MMMAERYGMVCVLSPLPDGVSAPLTEWFDGFPEGSVYVGDELSHEILVDLVKSEGMSAVFRAVNWAMRRKMKEDGRWLTKN
jgi:hypothetical protein